MKNIFTYFLLFFCTFATFADDNWTFSSINIEHENGKIEVSGRVTGSGCKKLRISAKIQNEKGLSDYVSGYIDNFEDAGSRLFSIKTISFSKRDNWSMISIEGSCSKFSF